MKNRSLNDKYTLLLSYDPCDVFKYFNVTEMCGLNLRDCQRYRSTKEDAYIAGLCNVNSGKPFVFINLSRCTDDIRTMGLVMHEMTHLSFKLFKDEEELITFAETESYKIIEIIKRLIWTRN